MIKNRVILFVFVALFCLQPAVVFASEGNQPEVNALGAVLMDARTGRILWGKDEHTPLAMASTTKIMTAILALEHGGLSETATVTARAAAAPKVKMGLMPGEKISLRDLLSATMLQSSNDAAVAIAEHIGGSVEAFCAAMTDKAREIGAMNTLFETPSGLDLGDHHSTAYDMALITRYALNVPGFKALIQQESHSVTSDKRAHSLVNKNRFLREFGGAEGVKTGFTGKAGYCFVGAARRGDVELISVVLASGWGQAGKERKWTDTKEIMKYGFESYTTITALDIESEAPDAIAIDYSKTPQVRTRYSNSVELPILDEAADIRIEPVLPERLEAPVAQGQRVGAASVYCGGELVATVDVLTVEGAERFDFFTCVQTALRGFVGFALELD